MAKTRKRIAFTAWSTDLCLNDALAFLQGSIPSHAMNLPLYRNERDVQHAIAPGETPVKLRIEEVD